MDAKEAKTLYEECKTAWGENYKEAKEDYRFYLGDTQWLEDDRRRREDSGRPCITANMLPQFVHQVSNSIRMNTPSIYVIPEDDTGSEETAEVLKGLIRKIEYISGADEVYDTASMCSIISSIGFIRVDHRYVKDSKDRQEIIIKRVQNPLAIYLDPASVECDGGDAKYAIVLDKMTVREFKKRWPNKAVVSFDDSENQNSQLESLTVAEIFDMDDKGVITRAMFSGQDKLEESIFPADYIPVVPVYGQELWVDGKRHLISLIRNAKDPQRRYNHWLSVESEILAKAPIAPFLAAEGQTEAYADAWQNPSDEMVLRYSQTDANGNPAPMPQRMPSAGVPTGAINASQSAYEDIKRALGMYDASVGQKSNETSGIAIEARKEQGAVSTFHFQDNLSRSIAQVGRVIISMIPRIYDSAQMLQIIDDEEKPQFVAVNGETRPEKQKVLHDLTTGNYSVKVVTNRPFTTRKEEITVKLGTLLEKNPAFMGVFGDLWAEDLDIPRAHKIAERIRRTIPPQIIGNEEEDLPFDPEKEQMRQAIEQLQGQLQQAQPLIEGKMAEYQLKESELSLKERELALKEQEAQFKAEIEAAKLKMEYDKTQTPEVEVMQTPKSLEDLRSELTRREQEEMLRMEQEAMQQQMMQEEEMRKEQERMEERQREDMEMQMKQAMMEILVGLRSDVQGLTMAVSNPPPMKVVRDESGQIIGSERV